MCLVLLSTVGKIEGYFPLYYIYLVIPHTLSHLLGLPVSFSLSRGAKSAFFIRIYPLSFLTSLHADLKPEFGPEINCRKERTLRKIHRLAQVVAKHEACFTEFYSSMHHYVDWDLSSDITSAHYHAMIILAKTQFRFRIAVASLLFLFSTQYPFLITPQFNDSPSPPPLSSPPLHPHSVHFLRPSVGWQTRCFWS